ncbi:MAG: thiamine pyrophosphate-dependent enzyme [Patescibacteria group bacterium]
MPEKILKHNPLFNPGHTACAGCGQAMTIQHITKALGSDVVIVNATGCSEVYSSKYGESAWGQPWVHSLFENSAPLGSGIAAALHQRGNKTTRVVVQGGDGATFDIGFGLISGMWERGDDVLYICYDNEAYMNTGVQSSGSTPHFANTTTTPAGKKNHGSQQYKKNMIDVALAHGLRYMATTTCGYLDDIENKVRKAMTFSGPRYIQILTTCVPGWGTKEDMAVDLGKLASETGLYPVLEYIDGALVNKMKVTKPKPVEEYLKHQKRFIHIIKDPERLAWVQGLAKRNINKYGLDK